MNKRWRKILITTLVLGGIIFLSVSCSSNPAASTPKTQYATVQRGNISIQVTGTGNLALETKDDLAFQVAGTVSSVNISVSDSVKKGQTLAELDTTDWNNQIKTLQKNLTTAQRNLVTAQRNVTTAQNNVTKAQNAIPGAQLTIQQAQIDLQSAQDNVGQIVSVKQGQDAVDTAELNLKTAQANYQTALITGDANLGNYPNYLKSLQDALTQAQKDLQAILNGTSFKVTSDVKLQVSQAQLQVQQKQNALQTALIALNNANQTVTDAQTAVGDAQTSQADAQQAVQDAQDALDQANALSPIIIAPYDGIITKVNVKGGDTVQKGTVAVEVADPSQFEANIIVSEQDIFSVKVGGNATVTLNALSGLSFPAKVTTIAPTATVQQGVVNYAVTVELTSLRPTIAGLGGNGRLNNGNGPNVAGSTPSATRSTASPSTPVKPPASNSTTPVPSTTNGNSSGGTLPTTLPGNMAALAQGYTLKDGLSATVNIMVSQQTNVLLVPSRAITRQGRNSVVQLVQGNTTVATNVQTGISDNSNTEITSGLNEGDQVALPTTSSTTNSTNRPGGLGGGQIFRMGG